MEDGVVGVGVFHGAEVVGALEEVLALAGGVFGADGLAVDALRGEALWRRGGGWSGVSVSRYDSYWGVWIRYCFRYVMMMMRMGMMRMIKRRRRRMRKDDDEDDDEDDERLDGYVYVYGVSMVWG